MAEKGRVLTGARARFSIEGRKVGYATDVNLGEGVTYEDLEVLDNIEVEEQVPTGYRVDTFTAARFYLVGETLKSLGYFPPTGANAQEHLINILNSGELAATLEDVKTGKIIALVEQVKVSQRNIRITARGAVGEDITFVAIRMKDESEI